MAYLWVVVCHSSSVQQLTRVTDLQTHLYRFVKRSSSSLIVEPVGLMQTLQQLPVNGFRQLSYLFGGKSFEMLQNAREI